MHTYTHPQAVQFVEDAEDHGYEVEHYHGRAYYVGPSIEVEDDYALSRALAAISVPCQWDNLGMGYVIHPRASDTGQ